MLKGLDIAAISGIASPRGFEEELIRLGGRLCTTSGMPTTIATISRRSLT
jgi:tetraacyldisaccharide-1-P 4'-kinase